MIKAGLKNYFYNLKYYFTIIGTLFVGAVIGLSIAIPNILSAISTMVNEIIEIIEETNIDFRTVKDYLVNSITSLDWTDPIASLKTLIDPEWLKGILNESFNLIAVELQPYGDLIAESVNAAIAKIVVLIGVFVFFCILGLICGYLLTKHLIRRNMAKRSIAKFILSYIAESVISTALIILCGWLFALWKPSVAVTSILSFVIYALFSLSLAYVVYGSGKVHIKDVINAKNFFLLLATDFIILLISIAFIIILTLLTNLFIGIMLGFAFVEIAMLVTSMNAENYVINLKSEPEPEEPVQEEDAADAA